MHIEPVEIYSDAPNAAVLRHPNRNFPGCLIQGDTLYSLLTTLEDVQKSSGRLPDDVAEELTDAIERLRELVEHYKIVLRSHNMDLPFYEPPSI
jgi:predicted RNase H-like HicB family nuclease